MLRTQFLYVALDAVLHSASVPALKAAAEQRTASKAAKVQTEELTASAWFEKGFRR